MSKEHQDELNDLTKTKEALERKLNTTPNDLSVLQSLITVYHRLLHCKISPTKAKTFTNRIGELKLKLGVLKVNDEEEAAE